MSEMSNQNSENNSVNRAGSVEEGSSPGRCSLVRQWGPGRHPTTIRTKWSKNVNKIVMECFFRSKPFDDDDRSCVIIDVKRELKRLWSLKKVEVVPVVVGALGCISKGFSGWMDTLGIKLNVGMVQKSVLLGTARILRKVLDM